jgi:hypothetical protein
MSKKELKDTAEKELKNTEGHGRRRFIWRMKKAGQGWTVQERGNGGAEDRRTGKS